MDATPAAIFPSPADISKAAKKAFPAKSKKKAKPKTLTTPGKRAALLKKVKAAKPKAKKKPAKKAAKPKKSKSEARPVIRSERFDMRISKVEKAKLLAKAKKLRRTVTSVVLEAIEKIK